MRRNQTPLDGIDFLRGRERLGHTGIQIRLPSASLRSPYESFLLLVAGLIGGFGLGIAFSMWMFLT